MKKRLHDIFWHGPVTPQASDRVIQSYFFMYMMGAHTLMNLLDDHEGDAESFQAMVDELRAELFQYAREDLQRLLRNMPTEGSA